MYMGVALDKLGRKADACKAFAELEYVNFNKTQIAEADQLESDFDRTVKLLPMPKQAKQKKKP